MTDKRIAVAQQLMNEAGKNFKVVRVEETHHPLEMQVIADDGAKHVVTGLLAYQIKHAS